jgi:hypothetical protein
MRMNARVPPPLTWHIFHIIADSFSPTIFTCILKLRVIGDFATFDNLMEKDENVIYELSCLASHIKK